MYYKHISNKYLQLIMASTALYSYATRMFDENLKKQRKIGIIDEYTTFDIKLFRDVIDFDNYEYEIVKKTNTIGFFMNWHLDNALVIKNKKTDEKNPDKVYISDRHTLHYYIKKPIFSLLVYESDYKKDFNGGTLEFIDGEIIKPKKGMYVLFNSNELHKVNKILSGERTNYLIKFYKKDKFK